MTIHRHYFFCVCAFVYVLVFYGVHFVCIFLCITLVHSFWRNTQILIYFKAYGKLFPDFMFC